MTTNGPPQPSVRPAEPARRLDRWGSVVVTDVPLAPSVGPEGPDVGRRFVQDANGTVTVYGTSGSVVYHIPAHEVAGITLGSRQSFIRRRPTWAIVLGVIGLFFFLIGIVFFFIKENVPVTVPTITVTTGSGRTLIFECAPTS